MKYISKNAVDQNENTGTNSCNIVESWNTAEFRYHHRPFGLLVYWSSCDVRNWTRAHRTTTVTNDNTRVLRYNQRDIEHDHNQNSHDTQRENNKQCINRKYYVKKLCVTKFVNIHHWFEQSHRKCFVLIESQNNDQRCPIAKNLYPSVKKRSLQRVLRCSTEEGWVK